LFYIHKLKQPGTQAKDTISILQTNCNYELQKRYQKSNVLL